MDIKDLKINHTYSNADIIKTFQCGNMGGMRRSNRTNTLVLVCDHTKSLYDDMWHGEVLHYTGMGKVGDQDLYAFQNKTLAYSGSNGVNVHLFEVLEPAQYIYRGEVKLVDKPYQAVQNDVDGNSRKVWVFPIKPIKEGEVITPTKFTIPEPKQISEKELEEKASDEYAESLDNDTLKRAAELRGKSSPNEKTVTTILRDRDPYVSAYVKRRAKGICDLCNMPAPFKDKTGKPYLESYHVVWLSRDGEDTINNAVALCPNCHKKMHVVEAEEDVNALKMALAYYKKNGK